LPSFERARRGIVVAPESRGIFPGLSVDENVTLQLPRSEDRDRVYERFPELANRRKLLAGSLSGGEQQMLTLAPVMIRQPRILVVDEPTLGLAPRIVTTLLEMLSYLRDDGVAVLLAEEKTRNVLSIADEVSFLERGRVVWSGPRGEMDDALLADTYLGQSRSGDVGRQEEQR